MGVCPARMVCCGGGGESDSTLADGAGISSTTTPSAVVKVTAEPRREAEPKSIELGAPTLLEDKGVFSSSVMVGSDVVASERGCGDTSPQVRAGEMMGDFAGL